MKECETEERTREEKESKVREQKDKERDIVLSQMKEKDVQSQALKDKEKSLWEKQQVNNAYCVNVIHIIMGEAGRGGGLGTLLVFD